MILDVAADGFLQFFHGFEDSAPDTPRGDDREEALDRVEPGCRCWREVEDPSWVVCQPFLDPGTPLDRAISATCSLSADLRTICARRTCFCRRLRSPTIADRRSRSWGKTMMRTVWAMPPASHASRPKQIFCLCQCTSLLASVSQALRSQGAYERDCPSDPDRLHRGARPNFVKIAPIMRELAKRPGLQPRLIHTGQHYDVAMNAVFFEELAFRARTSIWRSARAAARSRRLAS